MVILSKIFKVSQRHLLVCGGHYVVFWKPYGGILAAGGEDVNAVSSNILGFQKLLGAIPDGSLSRETHFSVAPITA